LEGANAVALFGQSGVPAPDLAQIYGLADMDGDGRLSQNEFFIAMKLIRARMAGNTIPAVYVILFQLDLTLIASLLSLGPVLPLE
jgi:hypothetical protein